MRPPDPRAPHEIRALKRRLGASRQVLKDAELVAEPVLQDTDNCAGRELA